MSLNKLTTGTQLGAGCIVQVVHTVYSDYVELSTAIPFDNTIPQNTEGAALSGLDTNITPKSSSNKLLVDVNVHWASSAGSGTGVGTQVCALFKDSEASARAVGMSGFSYVGTGGPGGPMQFKYMMTTGTTSQIAFTLRWGRHSGGFPGHINGWNSAAMWGGASASTVTIWEIAA